MTDATPAAPAAKLYTPTTERVRYCATTEGAWLAYRPESFDRWLAELLDSAREEGAKEERDRPRSPSSRIPAGDDLWPGY